MRFGKLLSSSKKMAESTYGKGKSALSKRATRGADELKKVAVSAKDSKTSQYVTSKATKAAGANIPSIPRSAIGLGVAGIGAASFSRGVGSAGGGAAFMQLAMGDPEFDQYAVGRNMSPRSLLMPIPGENNRFRMLNTTTYGNARAASRARNRRPANVSGSVTLGMYNARLS